MLKVSIMQKLLSITLIIVGVIHFLPIIGIIGSEQLLRLYAIKINDPNLEILMRHRAVLFGLLGVFLTYSAFKPKLQFMSIIAGFISVVSFIGLAWSVGDYDEAIQKIITVDLVALVLLLIASIMYGLNKKLLA